MNRKIAILLSCWLSLLSFFPKTDFQHIADISFLIQHYQEHQQSQAISFWEYLVIHYTQNPHSKEEKHKHKQLPLQHQHLDFQASFTVPELPILNLPTFYPQHKRFFSERKHFYHFTNLKGIFQPPKFDI